MTTSIDITLTLIGDLDHFGNAEEAEEFVDAFMDQIHGSDAIDPSVGADIDSDTGTVTIEVDLCRDGDDTFAAIDWTMGLIRSCLHAVNVGTPGWEKATQSLLSQLSLRQVPEDGNHHHGNLIPA